tara:strand:- start:2793 stop:3650 length:858 start_codon:yes stop_codon:yes gene_type:complete
MNKVLRDSKFITLCLTLIIVSTTLTIEKLASTPVNYVLSFSGFSSNIIAGMLDFFGLTYSFVAGVLAAFNPCGIVMLPAYLGLYINRKSGEISVPPHKKITNSIGVIVFVGLGFISLFSVVAVLVTLSSELVRESIPIICIALSILILYFGIAEFQNKSTFSTVITQLSAKIGNPNSANPMAFILFGISYGLASVGCALPIFISMITRTLDSQNILSTFVNFLLYSFGMIFVITVLTIMTLISTDYIKKLNRFFRQWSQIIFGTFLSIAGVFMLAYWIIDLRLAG